MSSVLNTSKDNHDRQLQMSHNHDNFNPLDYDPMKRAFFRPTTKDEYHQFTGHNVFKICIVCGTFSMVFKQ